MSLILRMAALILFLAVLSGERTPLYACDFGSCQVLGSQPPYFYVECEGVTCYDFAPCMEGFLILGCWDYEAGLQATLQYMG